MSPRLCLSHKGNIYCGIQLARQLRMTEPEFAAQIKEVEKSQLFSELHNAGVISIDTFARARFAQRHISGEPSGSAIHGLGDLLEGQEELVQLIQNIGQDRFEHAFIQESGDDDASKAALCGISLDQARNLRELMDRIYTQREFSASDASGSTSIGDGPESAIARIELENGQPVIGFFNREIWKGRYRINEAERQSFLRSKSPLETRRLAALLREIENLNRRKTTLYRIFEILLDAQKEFFQSGDPLRRQAMTQRELASRLDISPSALHHLLSNKLVELPWGARVSFKSLVPNRKALLLDHLGQLFAKQANLTDEALRTEAAALYGAVLSRRSISRYRRSLGLENYRHRRLGMLPDDILYRVQ